MKPKEGDSGYEAWSSENYLVMSWLINSMEPKINGSYLFYKIAKEIWSVRKEMYFDLDNYDKFFEIMSTVKECKQDYAYVTLNFHTLTGL